MNYVKKHLIENLVNKIKLLKILTNSSCNKLAEKVKLIEKIGKTSISKTVLDFIGVTLSDYKILTTIIPAQNSNSVLAPNSNYNEKDNSEENGSTKKEESKPPITSCLVLSSRVKPIEELPSILASERNSNEASTSTTTSTSSSATASMYDNMLSPYSNGKEKQRRNSKSPAKTKDDEAASGKFNNFWRQKFGAKVSFRFCGIQCFTERHS